jgi:hypothetical protein
MAPYILSWDLEGGWWGDKIYRAFWFSSNAENGQNKLRNKKLQKMTAIIRAIKFKT